MAHLASLVNHCSPPSFCEITHCQRRATHTEQKRFSALCGEHARRLRFTTVVPYCRPHDSHFASTIADQRGRITIATNQDMTFSAACKGSVSVRFRQMRSETGGDLLPSLAFENLGPVRMSVEGCPSVCPTLAHLNSLCAVYGFQQAQTWHTQFCRGLRSTYPPHGLSPSQRDVFRTFCPRLLEPVAYVNWTSSDAAHLTPLQFRSKFCALYELFVQDSPALGLLRAAHKNGTSVVFWQEEFCEPVEVSAALLCERFESVGSHFGAEHAVACMLFFDNPSDYPWNSFVTRNKEVFDQTAR